MGKPYTGGPLPRGACVISRADWERMKSPRTSSLLGGGDAGSRGAKTMSDAERRREVSKATTATWTNTIKGLRARRLAAKAVREEELERQRCIEDAEEEAAEAARRQEVLDRARMLMMLEKDRVKQFQQSVLNAEVIRDRKRATNVQGARVAHENRLDQERIEMAAVELREAVKAEEAKQMETRLRSMMLAEDQLQQAADRRQERMADLRRREDEGRQIHAEAAEYRQKEKEKAERIMEERLQLEREMDAQVADNRRRAEDWRAFQTAEDAAIERRAAGQRKIKQMREEKEAKTRAEKQAHKDRITAMLTQVQESKDAEEQAARDKAIAEREAADVAREAAKVAKRDKAWSEIRVHTDSEIRKRALERAAAAQREQERVDLMRKDLQDYERAEAEKFARKREQELAILKTLDSQTEEQRKARDSFRVESMALRRELEDRNRREDAEFQAFAAHQLDVLKGVGCDEVEHVVRAAMPHQRRPESVDMSSPAYQDTQGNPFPGNTRKRLGFTWE